VDNAGAKGVGGAVGNFLQRAGEFIRDTANDAADWARDNVGKDERSSD
jgi:hypothetical protein